MTSYIAITDAETDPEAPLTSELAKKWRDNPLAIAEGDTSVPTSLLSSSVLLGTLTTTSGTTQTLSSLNLNPYSLLYIEFLSVSVSGGSGPITLAGATVTTTLSGTSENWQGVTLLNLNSGRAISNTIRSGNPSVFWTSFVSTGYSKSTTSITFATNSGSFDAGSIAVYGIK